MSDHSAEAKAAYPNAYVDLVRTAFDLRMAAGRESRDFAEAKADAWDEAMVTALRLVMQRIGGYETSIDLLAEVNPYRAGGVA